MPWSIGWIKGVKLGGKITTSTGMHVVKSDKFVVWLGSLSIISSALCLSSLISQ